MRLENAPSVLRSAATGVLKPLDLSMGYITRRFPGRTARGKPDDALVDVGGHHGSPPLSRRRQRGTG